jgi:pyrroloquinoline quinone biosynthesis protein B
VVLTSGEIDAITGLLSLRENHSFAIYAGNDVLHVLDANPIFAALQPCVSLGASCDSAPRRCFATPLACPWT